ncbi:MAG: hypothetical protein AAF253_07130 [Pseudomonadota bacterium]
MLRFISVLLILGGLAAAGFAGLRLMADDRPVAASQPAAPAPESTPTTRAAAPPPVPAPEIAESSFEIMGTAQTRDAAQALREVPIAHEAPDEVIMGETFEVTLAIDATGADTAARTLPGQGNIVEGDAMVGAEAKALLTGTSFEIESLSPELQSVSEFAANSWRWRVQAKAEGRHDLVLEIFAMDGERALPVRSYRDTVTVQVTTVGRLVNAANDANPIVMLLGGIGSILGGALGVFRFFRR